MSFSLGKTYTNLSKIHHQPVEEKVFRLLTHIIFWRTKADWSIQWAMTKHAFDYLDHVLMHAPYFSTAPEVIFCGIHIG